MKKLLFLLFLFIPFAVGGQVIRSSPAYNKVAVSGVDYNAEYDTVLAAMTTDPVDSIKGFQNEMVDSLVYYGYWDRMDLLYIFATSVNTGGEALIQWINPGTFDATVSNAPAWTTLQGYTTDRSSDQIISTNYTPSTNHINITNDEATMGDYLLINPAGDFGSDCGCDGTVDMYFTARNQVNVAYLYVNSGSSLTAASADAQGLWIGTGRVDNTGELYRNGASFVAGSLWPATLCDAVLYIGGRSVANDHDGEHALFFLMDEVSDAEELAISNIFNRYMTHLGKNEY